jgi:hypothetical protein
MPLDPDDVHGPNTFSPPPYVSRPPESCRLALQWHSTESCHLQTTAPQQEEALGFAPRSLSRLIPKIVWYQMKTSGVTMNTLADLNGTRWSGSAELWVDPLGDDVARSACTLSVESDGVRYKWNHEGQDHVGKVTLCDDRAVFTDTWHQPDEMSCQRLDGVPGLFQIEGRYGPQSDWGWRISLSYRTPTRELVLQMTNIAPWGEEARAVRMVCRQVDPPSGTS